MNIEITFVRHLSEALKKQIQKDLNLQAFAFLQIVFLEKLKIKKGELS